MKSNLKSGLKGALVISAIGVLLAGCSTPAAETETGTEGSGELTKVIVSFNPATQNAPMFLGIEDGIFEKHGLELEIVPQTDIAAIIAGLASNQIDFGFATAVHLVNAALNNISLKAVATPDGQQATEETDESGNALVAGPDSGIEGPGDLEGKTLAVIGLSSLNTLGAWALADEAGVDFKSIELVQLPFGQMPAALAAGDVDAAVIQSPFIAQAVAEGSTVVAKPNVELFGDKAVGLFLTSDSYIASNPEIVQAFADAMVESQEYAADNVEAAQDTLIKYLQLTPEAAKAATWCTVCNPYVNADGIDTVQKLLTKFADQKKIIPGKDLVFPGALEK